MSALLALLAALNAPDDRVSIAFWRTGDDGLSQRFYHAIDQRLINSDVVRPYHGDRPAQYVLRAETNVRPLRTGSEHFKYRISLRRSGAANSPVVSRFDGQCKRPLIACAEHVVSGLEQLLRTKG